MTDGWQFTKHVLGQMAERGVSVDEVLAAVDRPVSVRPNKLSDFCRSYVGPHGVVAVADPETRIIVTVLIQGYDKKSWEQGAVERARNAKPVQEERVVRQVRPKSERQINRMKKRLQAGQKPEIVQPKSGPVVIRSIDEAPKPINPVILAAMEDEIGHDWSDYIVVYHSPVKVEWRMRKTPISV